MTIHRRYNRTAFAGESVGTALVIFAVLMIIVWVFVR